jgi:hypothetical protein
MEYMNDRVAQQEEKRLNRKKVVSFDLSAHGTASVPVSPRKELHPQRIFVMDN